MTYVSGKSSCSYASVGISIMVHLWRDLDVLFLNLSSHFSHLWTTYSHLPSCENNFLLLSKINQHHNEIMFYPAFLSPSLSFSGCFLLQHVSLLCCFTFIYGICSFCVKQHACGSPSTRRKIFLKNLALALDPNLSSWRTHGKIKNNKTGHTWD